MKPLIKYRGGKTRELPQIMAHLPKFTGRYVEPFFGGGALYFYLEPAQAIINDINKRLMAFYRGVRDDYDALRFELDGIERLYTANRVRFDALKADNPGEHVPDENEQLYYHLRAMYNGTEKSTYSEALLYYYINKTAYSGMIRYNANGEFNVPFGRYARLNTGVVTRQHSELLRCADLHNDDYSAVFDMCDADDFVFLDPPYDCVFSDYGNEQYRDGFNEDSHRRLAADFRNLPCKAMIVIGSTELTRELYDGYIVDEYEKNYAVNIRNRFKAAARHIIVTNYKENIVTVKEFASYNKLTVAQMAAFEREGEYYGKNK